MAATKTPPRASGPAREGTVTLVAMPDGKMPWHFMSVKQLGRTRCGIDFTPGNWHREDSVDPRVVRFKNRNVCGSCVELTVADRDKAKQGNGYHGATAEQAQHYLDLHPTGVLVVWIPSDAGTDDIPAAWRIRKDDYGFWLERKALANDLDNWGVANQMRQPEVKGLLAQLRERNGGAAAFADNTSTEEQDMATKTKTAARKAGGTSKSTTSRRATMTQTAAGTATDAKAAVKALTDAVKAKGIKGLKVEAGTNGVRTYYRTEHGTLGFARLGSRKAAVVVGKDARAELTAASADKFAEKMAKRAAKLTEEAASA